MSTPLPRELIRNATMSADAIAYEYKGTEAGRVQAIVVRALEALVANGMITIVPESEWPEWYAADPPYATDLPITGSMTRAQEAGHAERRTTGMSEHETIVLTNLRSTLPSGATVEFPEVAMRTIVDEQPPIDYGFWRAQDPSPTMRVELEPIPQADGIVYLLRVPKNRRARLWEAVKDFGRALGS